MTNSNSGVIGTEVEIIRQRFFIDYTTKTQRHFAEEYTFYCITDNEEGIDNIFLKIPHILPNLRVFDSDGEELPLITNTLLNALLTKRIREAADDKTKTELQQFQKDIDERKYFVLWIKLPSSKKLHRGEAKVITLEYDVPQVALSEKTHVQELHSEKYEVFYVITPPEDYEITNTNFLIYASDGTELKRHEKQWLNKKGDPIYFDDKHRSISIRVKPQIDDQIVFSYSFKAHASILQLPKITLGFLIAASASLFVPNLLGYNKDTVISCTKMTFCFDLTQLYSKQAEISIGIIGASLVIAGLIHNQDIRDSIKWQFFIPIGVSIISLVLKFTIL